MERGSVSVGHKSKGAAHHLPPLRFHVLKQIILAAQDGQGDREGVQQVVIWVVITKPVPCPLPQPLNKFWLSGL